jgi:hypothetical protein
MIKHADLGGNGKMEKIKRRFDLHETFDFNGLTIPLAIELLKQVELIAEKGGYEDVIMHEDYGPVFFTGVRLETDREFEARKKAKLFSANQMEFLKNFGEAQRRADELLGGP